MLWRTRFERINFGFDPVLYQMADVVFECDVLEYKQDAETLGLLADAAWEAVWKQNPHWKNPHGPLKWHDGWSTVLGGYPGSKYFKVKKATESMADKKFPQRRRGED